MNLIPGSGDKAVFNSHSGGQDCDVNYNQQTVGYLNVTGSGLLTVSSGGVLNVQNGTDTGEGIDKNITVSGTLNLKGGTTVIHNANVSGHGVVFLAGGNLTFANTAIVTWQPDVNVNWGSGTGNTLKIANSAGITLTSTSNSTPQWNVGTTGTFDINVDNTGGLAVDGSTTTYNPLDLQGALVKDGTLASAPNNYYAINLPIKVDGSSASVSIAAGDGISVPHGQGAGPAGSGVTASGNRGEGVYMTGGTFTLNNGAIFKAAGFQMDGGTFKCAGPSGSDSWTIDMGGGAFYLNGGSLYMGGTGAGDYGTVTLKGASNYYDFQWYTSTSTVYFGIGSGGYSNLDMQGNKVWIDSGVGANALQYVGTPTIHTVYNVIQNVVTGGLSDNQDPVPGSGWVGHVSSSGSDTYYAWYV
jgi:hypothetical protein